MHPKEVVFDEAYYCSSCNSIFTDESPYEIEIVNLRDIYYEIPGDIIDVNELNDKVNDNSVGRYKCGYCYEIDEEDTSISFLGGDTIFKCRYCNTIHDDYDEADECCR